MLCAAALLLLAACAGPEETESPDVSPNTDSSAPVTPFQEPVTSDEPLQIDPTAPVYVDWSKLESTPPQGAQYSRWYEGYTDQLIPVEGGYGEPLIPFAGVALEQAYGWTIDLYGLATAHGTVVCDPVYDSIFAAGSYYDYATERRVGTDSFLLLYKTVMEDGVDEYGYPIGQRLFTVAARDGSWVLDKLFDYNYTLNDGRLLLVDTDEALWFCNIDGTLERSPLREKPSDLWGSWWWEMGGFFNGVACMSAVEDGEWIHDRYIMANTLTGEVRVLDGLSYVDYTPLNNGLIEAQDAATQLYGFLDMDGSWDIEPQFLSTWGFDGKYARVTLVDGTFGMIDCAGNVVLTLEGDSLRDCGTYYLDCTWSDDTRMEMVHAVYDRDLRLIPNHPLTRQVLVSSYGTAVVESSGLYIIWDGDKSYTVQTDARFQNYDRQSGRAVFHSEVIFDRPLSSGETVPETVTTQGVYDVAAGKWIIPLGKYGSVSDCGQVYFCTPLNGAWSSGDVLDRDGNFIVRTDEYPTVENGLICLRDGDYYGWVDLQGNWMFRWPMQTNND